MFVKFISPKKSVNSAFLKLPVSVENMEHFKLSLVNLYKKRDATRDEKYHKGEIWGFLKGMFNPGYSVQVKLPIGLAIFNGKDASKPVVIVEVESPANVTNGPNVDISALEKQVDPKVYELYGLSVEKIRTEDRIENVFNVMV